MFGRVPRLPGGILTDDAAITSSPTTLEPQDNLMAKGEIIRSEAQKHLIDLNVNQQFRRAILRRTRNTRYQDLMPGQTCAFWRWNRKGQRKRGAWAIARFLSWDPSAPTKLARLRTGNTTVLVSAEQLRGAMGFESWSPSTEDIAALKDASKSFFDNMIEDETGPQAPDETLADEIPTLDQLPPSLTAPPTPLPAQPSPSPLEPEPPQLPPEATQQPTMHYRQQQQQNTNINISSPTYRQTNVYQRLGTPPKAMMRQPSTPPPIAKIRGRSRSPKPITAQRASATVPKPVSLPALQSSASAQPDEQSPGEDQLLETLAQIAEDAALQQQQLPLDPESETPYPPPDGTGPQVMDQQSEMQDELEPPVSQPKPATSVVSSSHEIETTGILPGDPVQAQKQDADPGVVSVSSGEPQKIPEQPQATSGAASSSPPPQADEPLPTLPQKRPFDVMFTIRNEDGRLYHQPALHDGSPDLGYGSTRNEYFKIYAATAQRQEDLDGTTKDAYESDTSADSDEDSVDPPPNSSSSPTSRLTRQEMKQLDRELPWREIWKMPPAYIQKFLAAIEKEANSWAEWNSIRPLSQEEINKVKADPILRKRILRSRAAYRDKNRNQGELKAKCRVVALGHQDPDLYDLTRSSPTPGRATEHLLYLIAVSGMNREFNQTKHLWQSWLGDAQTAFLQGRQPDGERKLPLFLKRPCDPLIDMTPYWKNELYQVTGNIYGLPNAPFLWMEEVVARLTALGYVRHDFDRMLFCLYGKDGQLISLVMCYVDDFFGIHREDHDPTDLFGKFRWGERSYFVENESKTFKGKELTFVKNSKGRFVLKITMQKFLDTVETYQLPRGRLQKGELLTASEQQEFRSIAGCLQWLGSQARPDVSSAISLCNHGQQTTIHDMKNLA